MRAASRRGCVWAIRARPELEAQLRQLGGLAGARLAGDHDDLVRADRLQQLLPVRADRELGRVRDQRQSRRLTRGGEPAARARRSARSRRASAATPRAACRGPCPRSISSRAPGIARAVARPPDAGTIRSLLPWMTSVGAVIVRSSGVRSPEWMIAASWRAPRGGVQAAVVAHAGDPPQVLVVALEVGRADLREDADGVLHVLLAVARRRLDEHGPDAGGTAGRSSATRCSTSIETSERTRSGCRAAIVWAIMPPIEAPTTCAALDPQVVEQPDAVARHVLERVAGGPLVAPQELEHRRHGAVHPLRPADVAVVEADHVEAAVGQRGAQVLVPAEHLRGEAHRQQHRGRLGVAERLVAELDVVVDGAELFRHGPKDVTAASRARTRFGRPRPAARTAPCSPRWRTAPSPPAACRW